jgi:Rrf2 family protein
MLSRQYGNGPVSISEIAKTEQIPRNFLSNILQEMKSAGIVGSLMGKNGGFFLTRSPEDIDLLSVIQSSESSIELLECARETDPGECMFCKDIYSCKTRDVFIDIRNYTIRKLKETSLHNI